MLIGNLKSRIRNNKEIIVILFIFMGLYSFHLDQYPCLWCDETWFINSAFNLAAHGFLGTTMMPTFYNISHFTYWQPPVYMVLLAVSFKLFGLGITQAKMVSVILGFFTVLFTYLLACELFNKKIGLLSSLLLISNPLFFLVARQARMDIAVACFTLIALYYLVLALKRSKYVYYFCSGLFAMLSLLSHPNGIFCMISMALIYMICKIDFKNLKLKIKLKEIFYLILGPILVAIPYLYYISLDFPAFLGQFKFNILNSANSPLNNIFLEKIRYMELVGFFNNIEGMFTLILLVASFYLALLGLLHIIKKKKKFNSKFLLIVLLVHLILFAVLVSQKYATWYLGIILPYWSILITLPFKGRFNYRKSSQTVIIILITLTLITNTFGILSILYTNDGYNYQSVPVAVQKYIPNGSVVVGATPYWITLHKNYTYYDYRYLDASDFKKLNVKYILYDNRWNYMLHNSYYMKDCHISPDTTAFLSNNCTLIGEIPYSHSITFGPIKVYKVNY
ncbi:Dolichyl-phosphate-mannose-protein mannosyltransferase [anaerobic digester metagenome]